MINKEHNHIPLWFITRHKNKIMLLTFVFLCGINVCKAQKDFFFIDAAKVSVSDSGLICLLDTMYHLTKECMSDIHPYYFYICESNFEGTSNYFGEALTFTEKSYMGMWDNSDLTESDALYWKTYYFHYNGVLCICNFDNEWYFEDVSKEVDTLSLPIFPPEELRYVLVVNHRGNAINGKIKKYDIYSSCDQ